MIHRRSDPSDESSVFLGRDGDSKKGLGSAAKLYRIGGTLCFLGLFVLVTTHSGKPTEKSGDTVVRKSQPEPMSHYPPLEKVFGQYENCTVSWVPPPPRKEWDTQPLWLPSYPGSGASSPNGKGDLMKPLIDRLTGLKAGAKNYHWSSKKLKKCKGQDETAVCTNGHPLVPCGPEKHVQKFHSKVLLLVRNYVTTLPTHLQDKAEAYHKAKEYMPENRWREMRDEFAVQAFEGWKNIITEWNAMKDYTIGAIVQYEELMDPARGPAAVARMANLLQTAGFTVAPKEDLSCIWFHVVKPEYQRLKDYLQYTHGYTKEQQGLLLIEMEKLQKEVADDQRLAAILKEYYEDIRDNMYIDIPYQTR